VLALSTGWLTACAPELPEGKSWRVDTAAWVGSPQCPEVTCALDAFRTRDFTAEAAVPGVLVDGAQVTVHCFVPTPAAHEDPSGRLAYRWYLVTVDGALLWAPDVALTSEDDLRRVPAPTEDPVAALAAGLRLCDSAVPGR
jgi:hypothetical protein